MSHGLPGDKFLGKDIHSAEERQLDEKLHEIHVAEDQRAGLSHLVANAIQMGWHLSPVQAGSMVMAEVVPLVHEVHVIKDGHSIYKIIFGMLRITEGVLNPRGDRHDEVHGEKRNQDVYDSNSPIINKDSGEIDEVSRYSPQHSSLVLYIPFGSEIGVWCEPQGGPNVV